MGKFSRINWELNDENMASLDVMRESRTSMHALWRAFLHAFLRAQMLLYQLYRVRMSQEELHSSQCETEVLREKKTKTYSYCS